MQKESKKVIPLPLNKVKDKPNISIHLIFWSSKHHNNQMESSGRKSELMKPILLKAGIPLAVSIGGFIYSLITNRRNCHHTRRSSRKTEEDGILDIQIRDKTGVEEELLSLKNQVRILMDKEHELETRFLSYCGLKEKEITFLELRNLLVLEIAHAEFLGMRVESMEAETRRFEALLDEYVRVVEQLEASKLENGLLHEKVKKLSRMNREKSRVLCRQNLVVGGREAEISRCQEELEGKTELVRKLEDEIMDMKGTVDKLLQEKKELVQKLEVAESSAFSATKELVEETVKKEDQAGMLTERKAQAVENEELIYLRWINACLRHELMRTQEPQIIHDQEEEKQDQQQQQEEVGNQIVVYDSDGSSTITEHGELCSRGGKKPKLLHKLRKWVKKSDACRRSWDEKEHKYKYSVSDA